MCIRDRRGTDYTYDPNKIPKKPEMYAVRKAIAFVKADPCLLYTSRCV